MTSFVTLPTMILAISEVDSDKACIDSEQPPIRTQIYGTRHLDNRLAG